MRLDSTDAAKSILPGVRAGFDKGFANAAPQWQVLAEVWNSKSKTETYPRLVGTGGPRSWGASRIVTGGEEQYFQITNEPYEVTMRIDWELILYEKLAQINKIAQHKGVQMALYRDQLILELLAAAGTTATYHGDNESYLVDTAHTDVGSGNTHSNKGTTALSPATLSAGRVTGLKIKDQAGKPSPIIYDKLVVGADLAETANELVKTEKVVDSGDNTWNWHYGALEVVVNPYQSDTNDWFLVCTKQVIKPMVWQSVEEPQPVYIVQDALKSEKFVDYGSHMVGQPSFTDWRLIYGAIVS